MLMRELTDSRAPEPASTDHSTKATTTSITPKAIENRKDVFITDQGSMRDNRSRALRVRRLRTDGDVAAGFEASPALVAGARFGVLGAAGAGGTGDVAGAPATGVVAQALAVDAARSDRVGVIRVDSSPLTFGASGAEVADVVDGADGVDSGLR